MRSELWGRVVSIQGQIWERFISNATTNGVWATKNVFRKKPSLNLEVDRGIDTHTCNDIKDCVCVYWMGNVYLSQCSDWCSLVVLKSIHAWYCSSTTARLLPSSLFSFLSPFHIVISPHSYPFLHFFSFSFSSFIPRLSHLSHFAFFFSLFYLRVFEGRYQCLYSTLKINSWYLYDVRCQGFSISNSFFFLGIAWANIPLQLQIIIEIFYRKYFRVKAGWIHSQKRNITVESNLTLWEVVVKEQLLIKRNNILVNLLSVN